MRFLYFILLSSRILCSGQGTGNTVGVLTYENPLDGFNLLYPHNQSGVFLINNCGEIVHLWEDDSSSRPGNVAYLYDDGRLVKAKRPLESDIETFGAGGSGGIFEWRDWNNNLINSFNLIDTQYRAHHDLAILPNGNILAIAWERIKLTEVYNNGADSVFHQVSERWPDVIVEIDPQLESIVWTWRAWDHLIQDIDSTIANFGTVKDHPGKIDLNADIGVFGLKPDWMHVNSIDYNPVLDQILISVPNFNEIWVIDHSTSMEEAASDSGGKYGKGGDLLYRWGNPLMFGQGGAGDQMLYFQHDARWIFQESSIYNGMISIFNNRVHSDSSNIQIIDPMSSLDHLYPLSSNGTYFPDSAFRIITHPERRIFSSGLSSAQLLGNDNFLITVGREGLVYEITPEDEVVWEYKVPLKSGIPVQQNSELLTNDNITFRVERYSFDHPAFINRELTPLSTIELDSNLSFCTTTKTEDLVHSSEILVFPNPAENHIFVRGVALNSWVKIYNLYGQLILTQRMNGDQKIELGDLPRSLYYIHTDEGFTSFVKL